MVFNHYGGYSEWWCVDIRIFSFAEPGNKRILNEFIIRWRILNRIKSLGGVKMSNFPQRVSEVKLFKIFVHFILFTIILSIIALMSIDVIGLVIGHPIEKNLDYFMPIMLLWVIYSLQSKKYRKQDNGTN